MEQTSLSNFSKQCLRPDDYYEAWDDRLQSVEERTTTRMTRISLLNNIGAGTRRYLRQKTIDTSMQMNIEEAYSYDTLMMMKPGRRSRSRCGDRTIS